MGHHFRNVCPACKVVSQCRCPGPKTTTAIACPGCNKQPYQPPPRPGIDVEECLADEVTQLRSKLAAVEAVWCEVHDAPNGPCPCCAAVRIADLEATASAVEAERDELRQTLRVAEVLGCPHHELKNPMREWGCPDCMREVRVERDALKARAEAAEARVAELEAEVTLWRDDAVQRGER